MVTSSDGVGESNISFVKNGDSSILTYLAENTLYAIPVDSIADNLVKADTNVGMINLLPEVLEEVVITAKPPLIIQKGDTTEFNANALKVPEDAELEDLLKKLPGVEVDSDGKITAGGKEIKKILVDGKEFFTNDPKVASKNLPVDIVDKLQVIDRKSDLARLTGVDDG